VFVKVNGRLCYLWRAVDQSPQSLPTEHCRELKRNTPSSNDRFLALNARS
jgi:hypothetical protein